MKEHTMDLHYGYIWVSIACTYSPPGPFRMYTRKGDPADPPDPEELEVTQVTLHCGQYHFKGLHLDMLSGDLQEAIERDALEEMRECYAALEEGEHP